MGNIRARAGGEAGIIVRLPIRRAHAVDLISAGQAWIGDDAIAVELTALVVCAGVITPKTVDAPLSGVL